MYSSSMNERKKKERKKERKKKKKTNLEDSFDAIYKEKTRVPFGI